MNIYVIIQIKQNIYSVIFQAKKKKTFFKPSHKIIASSDVERNNTRGWSFRFKFPFLNNYIAEINS